MGLSPPCGAGSTNPRLAFSHHGGRYRPGRPPFSSPVCLRCTCMEGFLIRGWDIIFPGWRWLYGPQVLFSTPWGWYRPGDHSFLPRFVGVVNVRKDLLSWDGTLSSQGGAGTFQVGVSTPCSTVSIRGTTVFVPRLLKLHMYGTISDPGMTSYPLPGWRWLYEPQVGV